jgi:hypothetical protein
MAYQLHNTTTDEWVAEGGRWVTGGNFSEARQFDTLEEAIRAALAIATDFSPYVLVLWRVGKGEQIDCIRLIYDGRVWEPKAATEEGHNE